MSGSIRGVFLVIVVGACGLWLVAASVGASSGTGYRAREVPTVDADDAGLERAGVVVDELIESLEAFNALFLRVERDEDVEADRAALEAAGDRHRAADMAVWALRYEFPSAYARAHGVQRERHDRALMAFNRHLRHLTPEGQRSPGGAIDDLLVRMLSESITVPYVVRSYWTDARVVEQYGLGSIQAGDGLAIELTDGWWRGIRTTAHSGHTSVWLSLPGMPEHDDWIDLELGASFFGSQFMARTIGELRDEDVVWARVRVVERTEDTLRLELDIQGAFRAKYRPGATAGPLELVGMVTVFRGALEAPAAE